MTVRVIRVLEYSFPDHAAAEKTLANGGVPANGVKFFGHTVIRSATTWPEEIIDRDTEEVQDDSVDKLRELRDQWLDERAGTDGGFYDGLSTAINDLDKIISPSKTPVTDYLREHANPAGPDREA